VSYILDALKKLEKERKRGRIPGLSEQDSIVYHSQRRPAWPYVLIAVFILNAALLLWWFLPKKPKDILVPTAPSSLPLAAQDISRDVKIPEIKGSGNVISSGAAESAPANRPMASPPAKDTVLRERLQSLRKMMQEDAQKSSSPMESEPKAFNEKQKEQPAAAPQEKKPEVVAEPLPDKKLYKLSELPPSVKNSLPDFSITAFLYSEQPSGRMARINERMMREGQEVEPGVRIEEIVSNGVILSYKKFHFFVSVK
jgi:general secretion pathway protein B